MSTPPRRTTLRRSRRVLALPILLATVAGCGATQTGGSGRSDSPAATSGTVLVSDGPAFACGLMPYNSDPSNYDPSNTDPPQFGITVTTDRLTDIRDVTVAGFSGTQEVGSTVVRIGTTAVPGQMTFRSLLPDDWYRTLVSGSVSYPGTYETAIDSCRILVWDGE